MSPEVKACLKNRSVVNAGFINACVLVGAFLGCASNSFDNKWKRKGVWIGAELGKKIAAALGRAGLGCDRQILSQVRLPDHEDIGTRLPRKQPAREPYLANRARREPFAGKLSRRLLSSAACGFNSSTLPPQSLIFWGGKES